MKRLKILEAKIMLVANSVRTNEQHQHKTNEIISILMKTDQTPEVQHRMVLVVNFFMFFELFVFVLLLLYVTWCTMWRLYMSC